LTETGKKKSQGNLICDLYIFLTCFVKQSPCEANRFSASQEIPCILWNPNVHYRTHKCPPTVHISEGSMQTLGRCIRCMTRPAITVRICYYIAHPPSWRTTPCQLSTTVYSICSQLHSILEAVPPSAI